MMRIAKLVLASTVCVIASVVVIASAMTAGCGRSSAAHVPKVEDSQSSSAQRLSSSDPKSSKANQLQFDVHIRQPDGPPTITLPAVDPQGRTSKVACTTCHSVRQANFENRNSVSLDEFHQGLEFKHGQLACYSCHHPENAGALRLADGTTVEYRDVMTLCSQCHSAQATSFAHGAHGGMNGYWDLSRGPQSKNHCIDCHDPHSPSYPKMIVDFKPRDRFLQQVEAPHDDHE